MKSKVSIIRCNSYDSSLVLEATKKAVDLIGGITSFVKPESTVLVNPNLLLAVEPETGVDTHPAVVEAVVEILKAIKCKIYLGDGPNVWGSQIENIDEVYRKSGMETIAKKQGIELVKFDKRRWRGKFPLTTWLDNCNYVVSIPKFKTHDLTILTGAIKNLFGLVPGTYKTEVHKKYPDAKDFSEILVDIYELARPCLTIVDGIVAMEGDGPGTSGKLRKCGLLLASSDSVALDSILTLIMGFSPEDIYTNKIAAERNLGVADINSIEILGERLEDVKVEPFKLPTPSLRDKIPKPVIELAKKFIRFYPQIEYNNCTLCGACIQACPSKIIKFENNRVVIDYSKCISCFCCQESCAHSAIKTKKSLLAKMLRI